MNITIEDLAPCKKLVRFEVDTSAVDAAFETVTKDFQREAALPGFRPGKAPRDMVIKRYEQDITDQVKRKLISETYQKGVKDKKLEVIGYPDIEEIQFAKGQALQFAATIETAPKFTSATPQRNRPAPSAPNRPNSRKQIAPSKRMISWC